MAAEPGPRIPGIKEMRPEVSGSEMFEFDTNVGHGGGSLLPPPPPGIRRVSLRAEIDTSPPFGSVKEAVTRFGGSGSWIPPYKLGENYNEVEEFDLKKVEEQATELEKDLIVKELETLDVLEELAKTKRVVEELKRELQNEALKCLTLPQEESNFLMLGNSSPYHLAASSPPDLIFMELKKAKMNLGKTINDLGVIQSSVKTLKKKMQDEKILLEKTREKMTKDSNFECKTEKMAEDSNFEAKTCMKRTAEMRWIAAKKMEEAAKAAEAVALADLRALGMQSPIKPKAQEAHGWYKKQLADAMFQIDEANASKLAILTKLKEATEEVNYSKKFLEEALSNVELANRNQLATQEALMIVVPENGTRQVTYNPRNLNKLIQPSERSRTNVSLEDVLSRKQVSPEDLVAKRETDSGHAETHRVALSEMVHALREDLTIPSKVEQKNENERQRKRFGFIQISLPLSRPKKKTQPLNTNVTH